jgi:hypothetical protein
MRDFNGLPLVVNTGDKNFKQKQKIFDESTGAKHWVLNPDIKDLA